MKPISQTEAEKLKRENRKLKQHIKSLTQAAVVMIEGVDWLMTETPNTPERGSRIARLSNLLDFQNDSAMHFAAGVPLDKLRAVHARARKWVKENVDKIEEPTHRR